MTAMWTLRLRLELPRLSFRSRGWQKKVLFRIFQMQKACEIIGKMCKIDWFFDRYCSTIDTYKRSNQGGI